VTQPRGEVGFSVYFKCDQTRETRADEIIESTIGPIHDRQVTAGRFDSWGWMEHIVGGDYRRILTMSAADIESLMTARTAIMEELYNGGSDAAQEFDGICGTHQDFIWNIVHEKP
jgi:hypothetical protein